MTHLKHKLVKVTVLTEFRLCAKVTSLWKLFSIDSLSRWPRQRRTSCWRNWTILSEKWPTLRWKWTESSVKLSAKQNKTRYDTKHWWDVLFPNLIRHRCSVHILHSNFCYYQVLFSYKFSIICDILLLFCDRWSTLFYWHNLTRFCVTYL